MAVMILNRHGDDVVKWGNDWWWAERGRIHNENKDTGAYQSLSVRDVLLRLKAISEAVPHRTDSVQTRVEQMLELCRKARKQMADIEAKMSH